jgi:ATP-dependent DNA ligase
MCPAYCIGKTPSFLISMAAQQVRALLKAKNGRTKFDGYRALVIKNSELIQIRSRSE